MSNTVEKHNPPQMNVAQAPGLSAALGVLQKFHARVLLGAEVNALVIEAAVLADHVDPDSPASAMADALCEKLQALRITESDARIVADAGFALDAQDVLPLAGHPESKQGGMNLRTAVLKCPTPSANDWKGSSKPGQRRGQLTDPAMGVIPAGGRLNPIFVEWLMGWPLDHTKPASLCHGSKPSVTDKSHCKPQLPSVSLSSCSEEVLA